MFKETINIGRLRTYDKELADLKDSEMVLVVDEKQDPKVLMNFNTYQRLSMYKTMIAPEGSPVKPTLEDMKKKSAKVGFEWQTAMAQGDELVDTLVNLLSSDELSDNKISPQTKELKEDLNLLLEKMVGEED